MDMPTFAQGGLVDRPGYYQQGGLEKERVPLPRPNEYRIGERVGELGNALSLMFGGGGGGRPQTPDIDVRTMPSEAETAPKFDYLRQAPPSTSAPLDIPDRPPPQIPGGTQRPETYRTAPDVLPPPANFRQQYPMQQAPSGPLWPRNLAPQYAPQTGPNEVQLQRGGPALGIPQMNTAGKQAHFGAMNIARATKPMPKIPGVHLIHSPVPGRVDRIPMQARTGSYVLPAHVVSGLGQGNTYAGARMWGQMIAHSIGPAGVQNTMKAARFKPPTLRPMQKFRDGGGVADDGYTPIIVSGGEMLVDPEIVEAMGNGDADEGKKALERSVKIIHQETLKHMKKLPPPVK